MATVLTIGGARFMGRFTVREFVARGDDVTLFTRGNAPIPFDEAAVDHVTGDRRDESALRAAVEAVDPDVVVDFAGFYPADVRAAIDIFADTDRYVFVSSTSAYRLDSAVPIREDRTPLEPCAPEQAVDESPESYGARKAECDRLLLDADETDAISVRPSAIYGPYDPTRRLDYWIQRARTYDRIVVPGDEYWMPMHLGYAPDVARAIRLAVERGEPGTAYNVANREQCRFHELIAHVARALDTRVTVVRASRRDLATVGCVPEDFSLCRPYPYVVSTERLAGLGWESTPLAEGIERAVEERLLAIAGGDVRSVGRP